VKQLEHCQPGSCTDQPRAPARSQANAGNETSAITEWFGAAEGGRIKPGAGRMSPVSALMLLIAALLASPAISADQHRRLLARCAWALA